MASEIPKRWGFEKTDSKPERVEEEASPQTDTDSAEEKSRLRGKLLEQVKKQENEDAQEISKLRGKLIDKTREADSSEPFSKEWLAKQTFIQRDGGAEFVVEDFHVGRSGDMIKLRNADSNATISHYVERFIERLQTPGEAWSVRES